MAKEGKTCSIQLISGDGEFNVNGIDHFAKVTNMGEHGLSYAVVAVIGPQSSGKSTLMNHVFGTKFRVMNDARWRHQTTQGVWLAKTDDIDHFTLLLDVEGADGEEREESIHFEKQSALFALAMSDVLIINLWDHDIGREQAGCRPLLKTVFQVMTRLCNPRKRTLLFVIRDAYNTQETSLERLRQQLQNWVQKIYDFVPKPETHKEMENIFEILVTALPHYKLQRMEFDKEVVSLRQRINSTISGGLARDQQERVHAPDFSNHAQKIWDLIKKNEDLDLPALKIMVGTVRCQKILEDSFAVFVGSEEWRNPVPHFGKNVTLSISKSLSKYNEETLSFDDDVRCAKRKELLAKLLKLVQPAYQSMLTDLHAKTLSNFKRDLRMALDNGDEFPTARQRCWSDSVSAFGKGYKDLAIEQANWDSSSVSAKQLESDINAHIELVHIQVISAKAVADAQATIVAAQIAAAEQAAAAAAQIAAAEQAAAAAAQIAAADARAAEAAQIAAADAAAHITAADARAAAAEQAVAAAHIAAANGRAQIAAADARAADARAAAAEKAAVAAAKEHGERMDEAAAIVRAFAVLAAEHAAAADARAAAAAAKTCVIQ